MQGEQASKGHEVVSLKNEVRELRLELDQKNKALADLRITSDNQNLQQSEVDKLTIQLEELKVKLDLVSLNYVIKGDCLVGELFI